LGSLERAKFNHWTAPVKERLTSRLALYFQSVRLGVKPLETQDQRFLFELNPCDNIP
jgi:hypothetical protein